MVETAVGRHNKTWYFIVKSACASGRYLSKSSKKEVGSIQRVIRPGFRGGSWLSLFSVFCWIANNNKKTQLFLEILRIPLRWSDHFLDRFESSRRPKGCAVQVLNPLIFSGRVEFPCHLVGVLVGWMQTTGFAYAAPTVVIMDNRGIIFSKRFHLLCM